MAQNPFSFDRSDPMGVTYAAAFYMLLILTCIFAWYMQPKSSKVLSPETSRFQWIFLGAWYICVFGDWLQGPYVYALYDSYGFSRSQISQLFVVGFGASMVFGTFVGSMADRIGRKRSCQLYCVLYIISCFTKHFASYRVLFVGRLTGGIATSLLFSGFESWLVAESTVRLKLDQDTLTHIFALMWFGNSLLAILAGLMGDAVLNLCPMHTLPNALGAGDLMKTFHYGGYTSPFDLAIVTLIVGLVVISFLWEENYGTTTEGTTQKGVGHQLVTGVFVIMQSRKLLILMFMVACFEGSMFTFVFNWTPALQNSLSSPPFGMIFATFMMAYMCGSSTFDMLSNCGYRTSMLVQVPFGIGAFCFLVASAAVNMTTTVWTLTEIFMCFVLFEFCCGLYFPAISSMKGRAVPEAIRSTVYNIYRVPMNGIVLVTLLTDLSMRSVFGLCFLLLAFAGASTIVYDASGWAWVTGKRPLTSTLEDMEASSTANLNEEEEKSMNYGSL